MNDTQHAERTAAIKAVADALLEIAKAIREKAMFPSSGGAGGR